MMAAPTLPSAKVLHSPFQNPNLMQLPLCREDVGEGAPGLSEACASAGISVVPSQPKPRSAQFSAHMAKLQVGGAGKWTNCIANALIHVNTL